MDAKAEIRRFHQAISHEIKAPLAAAREFLALTLQGAAGAVTASQREFLEHALGSCDDIARLIDDLFDATRLDAGAVGLRRAPTAAATVVARAVASSAPLARARRVSLQCFVPPDLPAVDVDGGRIVQAIASLVHNAVKFSVPGGRVAVRASRALGRHVEVRVSDNGCGIAEEHLPNIFQRFYQGGVAETQAEPGLGLGLFIAREIVRRHGGELFVASKPGRGSAFWFAVPLASAR